MTGKYSTAGTPPQTNPAEAVPGASGAVDSKSMLSGHKGPLALGVAAALGIMIYYNWREKALAKKDPEGYARLKRFRDLIKEEAADVPCGEEPQPDKDAADN